MYLYRIVFVWNFVSRCSASIASLKEWPKVPVVNLGFSYPYLPLQHLLLHTSASTEWREGLQRGE
jgi:hypothetical protein